jgi:hypothetical protein
MSQMHKLFQRTNTKSKTPKAPKSRLKKWILWLSLIFIVIPALVIIFISPITKYLVEKYDVKYLGREVKMDWAYVNPFTGYLHFKNLKIYENKSDSLFLSTEGLSANFSIRKFLSKEYEITSIALDKPKITIIMAGKKINLDDMIEKFSGDTLGPKKAPVHFNINKITIEDGEFHYREEIVPVNYYIKKVNIDCSGLRWDNDSIAGDFSFIPGIGAGSMEGNLKLNYKNLDYKLRTVMKKFDLNFIGQYVKALANYGSFRANLDANIDATGNFKDAENLVAKGLLQFNDFHFGKDTVEDYCSFEKFTIQIKELSPKNHKYMFDSLTLSKPFFKFERYDHLDNVQTMFGQKGANLAAANANPEKFNLVIEIGNYVKELSRNFFSSYYQVNRLAVYNGNMIYNDFTLDEEFSMAANPLTVIADSIDKNHARVKFNFQSGIQPYGNLNVDLSINPKDSTDFDLTYHFDKFAVPMLNPFIIKYTSFATDRGAIELNGSWHVRNGFINSDNHLIILDPRIACRVKNEDSKYIPMRLVMAFVRESGNVIDYEIPIKGNLKDPNFKLWDVITDIIANIFIKPVTTPYRVQVKVTEEKIENSISLRWNPRQSKMEEAQEKFVKKMAEFLEDNPEAKISVSPMEYEAKERESILLFEAKKKFYLQQHGITTANFSEDDSMEIEYLSIKDSSFVRYLDKNIHDTLIFTTQEKCIRLVGYDLVNKRYNQLMEARKKEFVSYFKTNGTASRVIIHKTENSIPVSGFSYFKIDYKGDIPKSLQKAYQELSTLNGENPRKKYLRLRAKYNHLLERKLRKE